MGMLGGMIAGAMGGAAQAAGSIADRQLDINDKQTMAKFNADVDVQKATAIANMQQGIDRSNKMWSVDQTPGGYADQARVGAVSDEKAKAIGMADPDVLAAGKAVEATKPYSLAPGHQRFVGETKTGDNTNMTAADARFAIGAGGAGGKVDHFDAKEVNATRKEMNAEFDKKYLDAATQKTFPAPGDIGGQIFNASINAGMQPAEARQRAESQVSKIADEAEQLMNSPQYKDQKLDKNKAMTLAVKLRQQKFDADNAAPGGAPAATPAAVTKPAPPAAATPAAPAAAPSEPAAVAPAASAAGAPAAPAGASTRATSGVIADAMRDSRHFPQAPPAPWVPPELSEKPWAPIQIKPRGGSSFGFN